ncbi:hypothetical protein [Arthrobacter sp. MMS18-M83]|uniref:hypothetical protein n=1 Tax=Arthrobacter sp. MMS18-M83 TaxID=2996261 RepID=UPI00227CF566|nr:hypothetical protein [Arthrobacter sp. MMS18-M83]WAH95443.1 hypothetical protein OW521_13365 [Arthrobacter sp. MMS18-M83]
MSTQSPVTAPVDSTGPAPVSAPAPSVHAHSAHVPSVHVRAVITWLAIFPLVAIGLTILGPLTESWHPALRALILTLVVVPTAVYFAVPKLLAGYGSLKRRQGRKAGARA